MNISVQSHCKVVIKSNVYNLISGKDVSEMSLDELNENEDEIDEEEERIFEQYR